MGIQMNAESNKDMAHKQNSLSTQTKGKVVAILGATGVVGTQMMRCLEERSFPVSSSSPWLLLALPEVLLTFVARRSRYVKRHLKPLRALISYLGLPVTLRPKSFYLKRLRTVVFVWITLMHFA